MRLTYTDLAESSASEMKEAQDSDEQKPCAVISCDDVKSTQMLDDRDYEAFVNARKSLTQLMRS